MEKSTVRAEFMAGVTRQGQGTDTGGDQRDPVITSEKKQNKPTHPFPHCMVITLPKHSSCDTTRLNSLLRRK